MTPVLKVGKIRFYFPEYPQHPYNGASYGGHSVATGYYQGLIVRRSIDTFEDTVFNRFNHWKRTGKHDKPMHLTASDFREDPGRVLVVLWDGSTGNSFTTKFYLH